MTSDATVLLREDGSYADASPAALAILGVDLDTLLSMPPGAFNAEAPNEEGSTAFRSDWEAAGQPDIVGESTIRRPDGESRRIQFQIRRYDDGRFLAILREVAEGAHGTKIYTAGDALMAWREAERRLEKLPAGSPEWNAIQSDIDSFRSAYQDAFERLRNPRQRA